MGKTNKIKADAVDIVTDSVKRVKKRKALNTDTSNVDKNKSVQQKSIKRNKNNVAANDATQHSEVESKQANKVVKHMSADNTDVNLMAEPIKAKRKKRDKNITVENDTIPRNKKIVFNDDGQVQDNAKKDGNKNGGNKQKQFLSGEEAAVTEEEIDRFCDGLDEEDNVQFDNWVKLVEEKLNPKRNKNT